MQIARCTVKSAGTSAKLFIEVSELRERMIQLTSLQLTEWKCKSVCTCLSLRVCEVLNPLRSVNIPRCRQHNDVSDARAYADAKSFSLVRNNIFFFSSPSLCFPPHHFYTPLRNTTKFVINFRGTA